MTNTKFMEIDLKSLAKLVLSSETPRLKPTKGASSPGYVQILTWGTATGQHKYRTPINKTLKNMNAGHGALVINLPETPENLFWYTRLKSAGYPCHIEQQPTVHKQIDDKGMVKYTQGAPENRFVIRYSAYAMQFADESSDQIVQRRGRPESWHPELYKNLTQFTEYVTELQEELKLVQQKIQQQHKQKPSDNKILDHLLAQKKVLVNDIKLHRFLFYEKTYRQIQDHEGCNVFTQAQAKILAGLSVKSEKHSPLNWGQGNANRGPFMIFHPTLMPDNIESEQDLIAAFKRNSKFLTLGTPPDDVVRLPLASSNHPYGLDLPKMMQQMLKIQLNKHLKFYKYSKQYLSLKTDGQQLKSLEIESKAKHFAKTKQFKLTPLIVRLEIYNQILNLASKCALQVNLQTLTQKPKSKVFAHVLGLYDELQQRLLRGKLSGYDPAPLFRFEALLRENEQVAWIDDVGMKSSTEFYNHNCCSQVKSLLRKSVLPQYKKYLTDSKIGLDTPGDLLEKSVKVHDKMLKHLMSSK